MCLSCRELITTRCGCPVDHCLTSDKVSQSQYKKLEENSTEILLKLLDLLTEIFEDVMATSKFMQM